MSAGADQVADFIIDRIQRIEGLLRRHGAPVLTVVDELDVQTNESRWDLRVRDTTIYRIVLAAGGERPAMVGRWLIDGLRAAGLGDVADKVDTIREGRAS